MPEWFRQRTGSITLCIYLLKVYSPVNRTGSPQGFAGLGGDKRVPESDTFHARLNSMTLTLMQGHSGSAEENVLGLAFNYLDSSVRNND